MKKTNVLILDDTPSTYRLNYGNAIPISTYCVSETHDTVLGALMFHLLQWKTCFSQFKTIRHVNKFLWELEDEKDEKDILCMCFQCMIHRFSVLDM